jgi:hypothetical protein
LVFSQINVTAGSTKTGINGKEIAAIGIKSRETTIVGMIERNQRASI